MSLHREDTFRWCVSSACKGSHLQLKRMSRKWDKKTFIIDLEELLLVRADKTDLYRPLV